VKLTPHLLVRQVAVERPAAQRQHHRQEDQAVRSQPWVRVAFIFSLCSFAMNTKEP
jgi:hypothetical protein